MSARFVSLDSVPNTEPRKFEVCFEEIAATPFYKKFEDEEPAIRESLQLGGMPQTKIDFYFEEAIRRSLCGKNR